LASRSVLLVISIDPSRIFWTASVRLTLRDDPCIALSLLQLSSVSNALHEASSRWCTSRDNHL
ncbi:MAG: hypothetical protein ABI882_13990, partial [Acidobacteriota bacterium]